MIFKWSNQIDLWYYVSTVTWYVCYIQYCLVYNIVTIAMGTEWNVEWSDNLGRLFHSVPFPFYRAVLTGVAGEAWSWSRRVPLEPAPRAAPPSSSPDTGPPRSRARPAAEGKPSPAEVPCPSQNREGTSPTALQLLTCPPSIFQLLPGDILARPLRARPQLEMQCRRAP